MTRKEMVTNWENRRAAVMEMRESGKGYADIGRALGITGQRVRQIEMSEIRRMKRAEWIKNQPPVILDPENIYGLDLSVRAANILNNMNISSVSELRGIMETSPETVFSRRNCGWNTLNELAILMDVKLTKSRAFFQSYKDRANHVGGYA